jgi:hypothetical protein
MGRSSRSCASCQLMQPARMRSELPWRSAVQSLQLLQRRLWQDGEAVEVAGNMAMEIHTHTRAHTPQNHTSTHLPIHQARRIENPQIEFFWQGLNRVLK